MAKSRYGKKSISNGKKFVITLGIIIFLVALFFLSFWITSMSLRANQEPDNLAVTGVPAASGDASATSTPKVDLKKLSKKELILLVEQKDRQIERLQEELEKGSVSTQAPLATIQPTIAPVATKKPETKTAAPTAAPTKAPVLETPAPTPVPTEPPAEPTPIPETTAPEVKPVDPSQGGE